MEPVIAILAYNRPEALRRLLVSLDSAIYPAKPKLFISLEGGASPEVASTAKNFRTPKLDVTVIERDERLGLRKHVIACADLASEFGSVLVLEDDLIVDRYFYYYASEALEFYDNADSIAGIALYSYEHNEFAGFPFRPMENGYSTYFMQVVCSSGQCWTKSQWESFKSWYEGENSSDIDAVDAIPLAVKNWPESSWKKYFHGYICSTGKNFVYPYSSFTTNCSDAGGTHIRNQSNIHQVSLGNPDRPRPRFDFCPIDVLDVVYDAYMEPVGNYVYQTLGIKNVQTDFHGIKPLALLKTSEYAITARNCRRSIAQYGYDFRPPELNLAFPIGNAQKEGWHLVKTAELQEHCRISTSFDRFSYFAGMSLMRRDFARAFVKKLIRASGRKIARKIGFKRSR